MDSMKLEDCCEILDSKRDPITASERKKFSVALIKLKILKRQLQEYNKYGGIKMFIKEDNTYNDIREKSLLQWLNEMEKHEDVAVRCGGYLAK